MKISPILFKTEMVQAILEGRKTMTRRTKGLDKVNEEPREWNYLSMSYDKAIFYNDKNYDVEINIKSRYGNPGDVLWVRETFRDIEQDYGIPRYEYKATEKINLTDKWKPCLFMPKKACRLFLEITSIKMQRLHNIHFIDALNEGMASVLENEDAVTKFHKLWQKINGEKMWANNPWVWVISFKQIQKPDNFF